MAERTMLGRPAVGNMPPNNGVVPTHNMAFPFAIFHNLEKQMVVVVTNALTTSLP